jgi:Calcineurin-like phosphoesterase superfamily domain
MVGNVIGEGPRGRPPNLGAMSSAAIGRLARRAALPLAAVAIAAAGTLLGLRLAGPSSGETALGRVSYEVVPSIPGGVEAYVPVADWGLRSEAFEGPFELRLELRTLERQALLDAAADDRSVLDRARSELRDGALDAVLRAILFALATTAVLAAIAVAIWPRARRAPAVLPVLTAGAAVVILGGGFALAWGSFDEAALESPTFYARGAELERLLAAAEAERVESGYGSELESIVRSVSTVLADEPIRGSPGRQLFLASDLHANPLVIDPLSSFFGGEPVLFVGDFGQRGTAPEAALLARRVAALGDPVLAVSGNHDSALLMERLASAGVTVIDREADGPYVRVDGLTIAGYPDPLEAAGGGLADPDRALTFEDFADGEEREERAAAALRAWFDGLIEAPDVVLVHQNGLAQALAESLWRDGYAQSLTIATGHDHLQHVDRYGPITVVDGGTLGAGGIFDAGVAFAGFAELHFETERPVLRAVDLVAVEPFSGRGRGSRVVIDTLCPGEDRCSVTPSELEIELPAEAAGSPPLD